MKIVVYTDTEENMGHGHTRVLVVSNKALEQCESGEDPDSLDGREMVMDITVKQLVDFWLKTHKPHYIADNPWTKKIFNEDQQ